MFSIPVFQFLLFCFIHGILLIVSDAITFCISHVLVNVLFVNRHMGTIKHKNDKVVYYQGTAIHGSKVYSVFETNVYLLFATLNIKYIISLPVVIAYFYHDHASVK